MFNLQQAGFIPVSRRAFGETDMIMIKIKAARRKPAVCPIKHLRKNNPALSIVGADLCVCPGRVYDVTPGQTHRSAPTINTAKFLPNCLCCKKMSKEVKV